MASGRAYRIRGRVQGVGFRWWAQRAATQLGLNGSVRNEPDGSVVVEVWGEDERLQAMEVELGNGPVGARVDAVERLADPAPPMPECFSIER